MSFINLSDNKVNLFKNQQVGYAYEADEILPSGNCDQDSDFRISQVSKPAKRELPEHLRDLMSVWHFKGGRGLFLEHGDYF